MRMVTNITSSGVLGIVVKKGIWQYLNMTDASSTRNIRKHARQCWSVDVVEVACNAKDIDKAREAVVKPLGMNSSITAVFDQKGKGVLTYSKQHTRTEMQ
jgi:hypothetical protein